MLSACLRSFLRVIQQLRLYTLLIASIYFNVAVFRLKSEKENFIKNKSRSLDSQSQIVKLANERVILLHSILQLIRLKQILINKKLVTKKALLKTFFLVVE